MEWHQHVVVKKIVPFGAGFGISFSQTRASHKKPHGSGRERVTFVDETTFVASSCLDFFFLEVT